ncbi:MAG TPA: hypothetical protein VKT49_10915 [Bryobacteraceae bacterium]|nr:hypothetical protein [Bryobacteraceae bacterium]
MKNIFRIAGALGLFAVASFANPTSMTLTGFGDWSTLGNVYLDPYTATVGSQTNVPVICDDWSNNTYQYESWQVNVINLSTVSDVTKGTPMFGNNQALYNELAWLGSQMMANPTSHTNQVETSFAIWALTYGANNTPKDPTAPLAYLQANLPLGANDPTYLATQALLTQAQSEGSYNGQGWEILTPIPNTSNPSTDGLPQEFLTYVPEPSSLGVMLAFAIVAALWANRRVKALQPALELRKLAR